MSQVIINIYELFRVVNIVASIVVCCGVQYLTIIYKENSMGLRTKLNSGTTKKVLANGTRYLSKAEEAEIDALCDQYGTTEKRYRRGLTFETGQVLTVPTSVVKSSKLLSDLFKMKVNGKENRTKIVLIENAFLLSFVREAPQQFGDKKLEFVEFEFHDANGVIPEAVMQELEKWMDAEEAAEAVKVNAGEAEKEDE